MHRKKTAFKCLLVNETSADNLFKLFLCMFYQNKRFIQKDLKAANGLKMKNEAPYFTTRAIKGYAKLTKTKKIEKDI